jgi:hypothetical protein
MWISVAAHDQLPVSKKDAACLASFSVENISPTMPTTRLWLLVGLSVPSFRLRVLARHARFSPGTLLDRVHPSRPDKRTRSPPMGPGVGGGDPARSMPRYRRGVDQFMLRPDSRSLPTFLDPTKPEKKGDSERLYILSFAMLLTSECG